MAKNWYFPFEYRVWQSDPALSQCSLAARGFWLEILCAMYAQEVYTVTGGVEKIARMTRCDSSEVAKYAIELKDANVCDVTLGNGDVTLLSRRLKRDISVKEQTRLRVQRSRSNANVTLHSNSNSNSKNNKKEKEEEKKATTAAVSDDQWLDSLQSNPAYKLLQVRTEYARAQVWAETNKRQCTRRFFVNWLNRAKPMDANTKQFKQNEKLPTTAEKLADAATNNAALIQPPRIIEGIQ